MVAAGVVDEVSGACSLLGVSCLLDSGALQAYAAIYAYTSLSVCIGHFGLIRLKLTGLVQSVHAGLAERHNRERGIDAVTALAVRFFQLEFMDSPATTPPGFERLDFGITLGTIFSRGSCPSVVPESAMASVDIRLLQGQSSADVLDRVREQIQVVEQKLPRTRIEMKVTVGIHGASIPKDHPLANHAKDYTEALTGRCWETAGAGPANEGYMLIGAGIPTLCVFGPTGGNLHAPDEWVEIDSLPATVAIFAGMIREYLN